MNEQITINQKLFNEISQLISEARNRVAKVANSELIMLYWNVGNHIKNDILMNNRARYGQAVIQGLSVKLTEQFGKGWSKEHLKHCLRSAQTLSEVEIRYAVRTQLAWTHIRSLFSIKDNLERQFFLTMCATEHWDTRTLDMKKEDMLFKRTIISSKPEELIRKELENLREQGTPSPDLVFKSSYFLDFLGLKEVYSEKDLEEAILVELQKFLSELGSDFAFIARQKQILIDSNSYWIDLLFYHRLLRRLVVIELKLGKFKPEHEGQMLLYLRWLNKYERRTGEESPLGLILCSEGNTEQIELLMLEGGNIKVAQYLLELPEKKLLERQLHLAIATARHKIEDELKDEKSK